MDYDSKIMERLKRVELLPTFSNIVGEVLNIIDDPMSSASDIAKHMDPSMVGEVLRIAGSAYFNTGGLRKISSIEHAIAMIGYEQLSHIVLQMPFLTLANKDDKIFDAKGFFNHSTLCGVLSKTISSSALLGNPNEVYISGIIHDVGIILIDRFFQDEWKEIISLMENENKSRLDAEREILSFDHGFLGAMLLDIWHIPKSITDGVRYHHCPEKAEENKENVAATYLGNLLSRQIDFKSDMDSFINFMMSHRDFIEKTTQFRRAFSSSEEIEFFQMIYNALKSTNNLLKGTENGSED
jgi:HD-like signal output (HDOD) protein